MPAPAEIPSTAVGLERVIPRAEPISRVGLQVGLLWNDLPYCLLGLWVDRRTIHLPLL
jgi:hypothetical protein